MTFDFMEFDLRQLIVETVASFPDQSTERGSFDLSGIFGFLFITLRPYPFETSSWQFYNKRN